MSKKTQAPGRSFIHTLHILFFGLSAVYFAINLVLFLKFAPFKTMVAGRSLSFSTLDNPLKISLVLLLMGLLFRTFGRRPRGLTRPQMLLFVFCAVFLTHLSSGVVTSFDSRWTIPTARSIIMEMNTDLDEYEKSMEPEDYRIKIIGGHSYSIFPIAVPLISVPFVWAFNDDVVAQSYGDVERLIASCLAALTSMFIYLIASTLLKSQKYGLLSVFLFAFCTSAWSTASRALWQQGPSMLMLTVVLWIMVSTENKPSLIQYSSLPLVFSYAVRPTNSISLFFLTAYVLLRYRKYFLRYCLWALCVAVPFILYNISVFHSLLSPYYQPQRIGSTLDFTEALAGHLISPSRGLLIYSPIFLLSLAAVLLKIKGTRLSVLDGFLLGTVGTHWIVISLFPHWWAGHSYGPRLFADMIP